MRLGMCPSTACGCLAPCQPQSAVSFRVEFDGIDGEAEIVRSLPDGFALHFAPSKEAHARLIRHIYCGKFGANVSDISAARVATAAVNRVFR